MKIVVKPFSRNGVKMFSAAVTLDGVHSIWSTVSTDPDTALRDATFEMERLNREIIAESMPA